MGWTAWVGCGWWVAWRGGRRTEGGEVCYAEVSTRFTPRCGLWAAAEETLGTGRPGHQLHEGPRWRKSCLKEMVKKLNETKSSSPFRLALTKSSWKWMKHYPLMKILI